MIRRRFLTSRDVQRRTGRHESSISEWRRRGFGPPFLKDGRHVLYPAAEFETWIAEHPEHDHPWSDDDDESPPRGRRPKETVLPPRISVPELLDMVGIGSTQLADLQRIGEAPRPVKFRDTEPGFERMVVEDWFDRLRGERPQWRPDRWPSTVTVST